MTEFRCRTCQQPYRLGTAAKTCEYLHDAVADGASVEVLDLKAPGRGPRVLAAIGLVLAAVAAVLALTADRSDGSTSQPRWACDTEDEVVVISGDCLHIDELTENR